MALCPAVFDPDILPLDIPGFCKAPSESRQVEGNFSVVGTCCSEQTNYGIAGDCPCAAKGHAAAVPATSVMNLRRCMCSPSAREPHPITLECRLVHHRKFGCRCPTWVNMRNTRGEYFTSAMPSITDIARTSRTSAKRQKQTSRRTARKRVAPYRVFQKATRPSE